MQLKFTVPELEELKRRLELLPEPFWLARLALKEEINRINNWR